MTMSRGASTRRPARVARLAPALAAAATLGVLAAGCGGSSSQEVAQLSTTTTTSAQSTSPAHSGDPVAYASCMRRHGVPNFPDPQGGEVQWNKGLESSPRFKAARNACKSLLPESKTGPTPSPEQRAQAQRLLLRYAACMRGHGVPTFPDPVVTPDGELDAADSGNTDSPRFRAAAEACRELGRGAKSALAPSSERGSTP